jgi:phage/plasmid-like protein (TIGR03299 family)
MPHEIEIFQDGTAAFVSANTPAWHRLGTVAPGPMTVAEALDMAQLANWNVRMEPLVAAVPNGKCAECSQPLGSIHDDLCVTGDHEGTDDSRVVDEHDTSIPVEVPYHRAVVRNHPVTGLPEVLSVGGLDYTPISNEVMGETLQAILDTSGAVVDTAGSLRGGLDTFTTARLPKGIMVGGVDAVELNLAGLNYFQPGRSSEFLITPVRVVCANTQAAALGNHRSRYTVRHSPNAPQRIQEAREALKITFDYRDAFADEAEKMIRADLTIKEFEKLCREIWLQPGEDANAAVKERDDQRRGSLLSIFKGETNENIRGKNTKGTHWSGYQTVVEYVDHFAPVRDTENAARIRAERALMGKALETKEQAFRLFQVA